VGDLQAWLFTVAAGVCAVGLAAAATDSGGPRVGVLLGEKAGEIERYAAEQLCGYLRKLFGIRARPTTRLPHSADVLLLIGNPETNPTVGQATARKAFPKLSEQGIVLRRLRFMGKPALLVGGGSPRATMWAVYELAGRWGVRYLLHGDVLPPRRRFYLPRVDEVMEPELPIRQWRVVNDFACGTESWGIEDYRPVLDQLAKLKFNRVFVSTYTYQPFLDLKVRGIRRKKATLWFDYHYPITDDMPGRKLFGDVPEMWNPDLPIGASYEELVAAARQHLRALMDHARRRGMECVMNADLIEFPPEFKRLLPDWREVHQLAKLTIVPGPNTAVEDPGLTELATAVLRQTVDTYPQVDFIALGMPEFRQWVEHYKRAWKALDRKYGIEKVRPLADVLAAAQERTGYPGGAERAVREVKGDIVSLYYYDRLLTDLRVMDDSHRPDVKFLIVNVAEELFPILGRILPPGAEAVHFVDYTPSRIVKRRQVLRNIPNREVPSTLQYTLHDDNTGLLPQLETGPLHKLTVELRRHGWAGFLTRYWLIGDHDPCVSYIARAAWDKSATPEDIYRDQISTVCGAAAVEDMLTVLREVEAATVLLEWHGLGLTFPVPGMMMKHWEPQPLPKEIIRVRERYRRALNAASRARKKVSGAGRKYVDYWIGRLRFGIEYLDAVEELRTAAAADADGKATEALRHAEAALAAACRGLEAYARVARDQSDRGAIAVMAEYVYRPLKAKVEELREKT